MRGTGRHNKFIPMGSQSSGRTLASRSHLGRLVGKNRLGAFERFLVDRIPNSWFWLKILPDIAVDGLGIGFFCSGQTDGRGSLGQLPFAGARDLSHGNCQVLCMVHSWTFKSLKLCADGRGRLLLQKMASIGVRKFPLDNHPFFWSKIRPYKKRGNKSR